MGVDDQLFSFHIYFWEQEPAKTTSRWIYKEFQAFKKGWSRKLLNQTKSGLWSCQKSSMVATRLVTSVIHHGVFSPACTATAEDQLAWNWILHTLPITCNYPPEMTNIDIENYHL